MTLGARVRGRRSPGRVAVAALALAVVLGGLVLLGRYEGRRHDRSELAGMRGVVALVGQLDNPSLDLYRINVDSRFDCLLYKRGANPAALELCFDSSGRVVEAIDRRGGKTTFSSLREDPAASTIRFPPTEIARLLKRLGAPLPRGG